MDDGVGAKRIGLDRRRRRSRSTMGGAAVRRYRKLRRRCTPHINATKKKRRRGRARRQQSTADVARGRACSRFYLGASLFSLATGARRPFVFLRSSDSAPEIYALDIAYLGRTFAALYRTVLLPPPSGATRIKYGAFIFNGRERTAASNEPLCIYPNMYVCLLIVPLHARLHTIACAAFIWPALNRGKSIPQLTRSQSPYSACVAD